ncbi:TfuA-like protein [Rhizobium oryzicola]|uniref:TfuA-like protein n=1 Tax=Rhizobium oryzicola TaxID=1232668 RepID=A0ABT8SZU7_9HYPH|nr:TfuA-like protein [Rhizobium oryzicola]MDO1583506.1 TfuA-like protein [Rhizobium oryzicola]
MKIIFVGPTLPDAIARCDRNIVVRRPAVQGDLLQAVREGASVIGLVDGNFEYTAPVWHKEILFGLSEGVRIFGSSSMGALRAAECHTFGMVGVGEVYRRFARGDLIDDSDIALLHAPAEIGYAPLSIPLVNILVTSERMLAAGIISKTELDRIGRIATQVFYKDRTWERLAKEMRAQGSDDDDILIEKVRASYIDVKREDALALLELVSSSPDKRSDMRVSWTFNSTSMWRHVFHGAKS